MIPILVDAGSDVNDLCDLASSTALMEAARRDNVECAKVLLARGADPLKRDKTGRVPLTHALMSNSAQVVELLTSLGDGVGLKAAANKADFDEFTSLHNAIVWNSNCVRAYLTILNGGPPASKAA
jgi:ankyrin repeat protein